MSYAETKKWRQAHPDQARAISGENSWRRDRKAGKPVRGRRGSYHAAKELKRMEKEAFAKAHNLRMK